MSTQEIGQITFNYSFYYEQWILQMLHILALCVSLFYNLRFSTQFNFDDFQ